MENPNCKCYMCKYCYKYYTKGVKKFNRTKFGWCRMNGKVVCLQDRCEKYVSRPVRNKYHDNLKYYLSGMLTEISEIRQILEEETRENEEMR